MSVIPKSFNQFNLKGNEQISSFAKEVFESKVFKLNAEHRGFCKASELLRQIEIRFVSAKKSGKLVLFGSLSIDIVREVDPDFGIFSYVGESEFAKLMIYADEDNNLITMFIVF